MKKIILLCLMLGLLTSFYNKKQKSWMAIGDSINYLNEKPEVTKNRITKGYMNSVIFHVLAVGSFSLLITFREAVRAFLRFHPSLHCA